MSAQSARDAQGRANFTFYNPVPMICDDKTHQGYVYKRTLKQLGYFLYDILAMPMTKHNLLVKHTLASFLSICFILSVYKLYLNHVIKTFQNALPVNITFTSVTAILSTFLTFIIIKYFCKHFFTLIQVTHKIPSNTPVMPLSEAHFDGFFVSGG